MQPIEDPSLIKQTIHDALVEFVFNHALEGYHRELDELIVRNAEISGVKDKDLFPLCTIFWKGEHYIHSKARKYPGVMVSDLNPAMFETFNTLKRERTQIDLEMHYVKNYFAELLSIGSNSKEWVYLLPHCLHQVMDNMMSFDGISCINEETANILFTRNKRAIKFIKEQLTLKLIT